MAKRSFKPKRQRAELARAKYLERGLIKLRIVVRQEKPKC